MDQRYSELKKLLTGKIGLNMLWGNSDAGDLDALALSPTLAVDLLPSVFVDQDQKAREAALEVSHFLLVVACIIRRVCIVSRGSRSHGPQVYIKRIYRAHRLLSVEVSSPDDLQSSAKWTFQYRLNPTSSPVRTGLMRVTVKDKMETDLVAMLADLRASDDSGTMGDVSRFPIDVLHLVVHDADDQQADDGMPQVPPDRKRGPPSHSPRAWVQTCGCARSYGCIKFEAQTLHASWRAEPQLLLNCVPDHGQTS